MKSDIDNAKNNKNQTDRRPKKRSRLMKPYRKQHPTDRAFRTRRIKGQADFKTYLSLIRPFFSARLGFHRTHACCR